MGGGGSRGPSTQVVKQESIPEYLQPYMQDIAARAQAVSREPYIPYGGQRIAGFTPGQMAVMGETGDLRTPEQYQQASALYRGMGEMYGPYGIKSYMSPYQQAVTDTAIRSAREESDRQRAQAALEAARSGTTRGSRQAVMDAMRESQLTQSVADIQARGSQTAFDKARDAQLASAQGLMALGGGQQKADLARLSAQATAAGAPQAMQQQIYDQRYGDFLRQRDYPKEQLGAYSSVLRGFPTPISSQQQTYAREPSVGQQIAGLGIAGLSFAQAGRG